MRALVCHEYGPAESLALEIVADPVPSPGEVVIRVHAAALNFPDTLAIEGKYQIRTPLPFVPGGEAAGTIIALGEGVGDWQLGDRVIVAGTSGAFAEQICKPARELIAMPHAMDFVTGAGFLAVYGTAYYALRQRANLQRDETLLVLGAAGGVGRASVDIGIALGARVIAAASSEEKLDIACDAGACERINYQREPLKERTKSLTKGVGADVVCDPVGGDLSEQALRAMKWNGRFLVIGFATGDIPRIPLNLCLLKGCALIGVFYGEFARREPAAYQRNIRELFAMYAEGKLHPLVSGRFLLDDYVQAFATLTKRQALGKLVFDLVDG